MRNDAQHQVLAIQQFPVLENHGESQEFELFLIHWIIVFDINSVLKVFGMS